MRISDWSSDVCSSDLMLDAFADREHMWIARHHMVVDLDTAPDREAGVAGERGRGTDADRHHDEAGGDQRSVLELHALDLAVTDNFGGVRSEEHTSELQSLMRISYAVFCLKKKKNQKNKI